MIVYGFDLLASCFAFLAERISENRAFGKMAGPHNLSIKNLIKLFVFVLTHGGFEGKGRLALIYAKENYFLRELLYWNTQEEKIIPSDIPKIYNQATTLKI